MWAYQYYLLIQEAAGTIDDYLVTTSAPSVINVSATTTHDAGTDPTSDAFYRTTKFHMVDNIAGGDLALPVVWCKDFDCPLSFTVDRLLVT